MANISNTVGELRYDGLVTDVNPAVVVSGGVIAHTSAEATYERGTVLGSKKERNDGKLYIMDQSRTLVPSAILCDPVTVGASDDATVTVYVAGCFDPNKLVAKDSYKLTDDDVDVLRTHGIYLKAPVK